MKPTSITNTAIPLTCDILFNSVPPPHPPVPLPQNKSLLWQCKTELKTPWLIRGIFGYTWWYVDKIKFETEGWGDGGRVWVGGGVKVFLTRAWRTTSKVVEARVKGMSEDLVWAQCHMELWGPEPGGRGNPWIKTETGSRTGTSAVGAEWMFQGSKGRVYLQQVFPLGTDKT